MGVESKNIDFEKMGGLVPVIIQDNATLVVLMQGYMNEEAFQKTSDLGKVTFYSRSKDRLWTKGEESGNFLAVKEILLDCDFDSLLIKVKPVGSVCHKGYDTCWKEKNEQKHFIHTLEKVLTERKSADPAESYTASLFAKGVNKVAQKVGEEAIELVIEAKDNNDELFKNEAADLLYHYLVLLIFKGFSLTDIEKVLIERHK